MKRVTAGIPSSHGLRPAQRPETTWECNCPPQCHHDGAKASPSAPLAVGMHLLTVHVDRSISLTVPS